MNPAWKKGVSGNPSGRPKKSPEQAEFEAKAREAIKTKGISFLVDRLENGKNDEKFKAVEILLDRGFGRAVQISENENYNINEFESLSDAELIEKIKTYANGTGQSQGDGGVTGLPANA